MYASPLSARTYEYLTRKDVLQTIGVSAVMGVDGIVLWSDFPSVRNKTMCIKAKKNLSNSLGPIIVMISQFLDDCSKTLWRRFSIFTTSVHDSISIVYRSPVNYKTASMPFTRSMYFTRCIYTGWCPKLDTHFKPYKFEYLVLSLLQRLPRQTLL